ncbi:MAG: hypothetical protein CSYNP_02141 [Syntrophus sp. SKADARSKE-3]|nr:hypothetical protein [Syntrophus sp. SKADARSKE-3]
MEPENVTKQMIDFQKTALDNTFRTMSIFQEQTERMMGMVLDQSSWIPPEGKNAIQTYVKAYKKGQADLKASADDGFAKLEGFFTSFNKQAK